jgi:hypothetical protein
MAADTKGDADERTLASLVTPGVNVNKKLDSGPDGPTKGRKIPESPGQRPTLLTSYRRLIFNFDCVLQGFIFGFATRSTIARTPSRISR